MSFFNKNIKPMGRKNHLALKIHVVNINNVRKIKIKLYLSLVELELES
jgi:hypothetical protein